MKEYLPGTRLARSGTYAAGLALLQGLFGATGGLMLSQVKELSGVDGPALQNWIKRGWVSSPVNKRYNIDQVARILIINMLRDSMQMEKISFLLRYINGSVYDRSDDIIPESRLYDYICRIWETIEETMISSPEKLRPQIEAAISDYHEMIPGAKGRLLNALEIIMTAYGAAVLKNKAEGLLQELRAQELKEGPSAEVAEPAGAAQAAG